MCDGSAEGSPYLGSNDKVLSRKISIVRGLTGSFGICKFASWLTLHWRKRKTLNWQNCILYNIIFLNTFHFIFISKWKGKVTVSFPHVKCVHSCTSQISVFLKCQPYRLKILGAGVLGHSPSLPLSCLISMVTKVLGLVLVKQWGPQISFHCILPLSHFCSETAQTPKWVHQSLIHGLEVLGDVSVGVIVAECRRWTSL